jgi:VanZ family protein
MLGKNKRTIVMCCNWLIVVIWLLIIWQLSAQSVLPGPQLFLGDFLLKKSGHMVMYALLYLWLWRAVYSSLKKPRPKKKCLWLGCFALLFMFAFLDEVHQSFVPGRTATVRDIGFDLIGAVTMWGIIYGVI